MTVLVVAGLVLGIMFSALLLVTLSGVAMHHFSKWVAQTDDGERVWRVADITKRVAGTRRRHTTQVRATRGHRRKVRKDPE